MNIFKSIKTKLIIQISLLVVISTLFVLVEVNYVAQQRPTPVSSIPVTVDTTLTFSQQREQIQQQVQQYIANERTENAARLLLASVIGISLQVILTSLGIFFLIKKELSPIEDLNKTMQDINEKLLYLQIEPDESTSIEIAQLITNFNLMMSKLDKAFKAQKQFVENVSHEIKTPLTVIKSNLESIIIDSEISLEERDLAISSSIESINFLNKLVEDLLLLSFIDKKDIKLESTDLVATTQDVIANCEQLVKSSNLKIKFSKPEEELIVSANNILLTRAISNLIENAIKYSKKKSNIEISLTKGDRNIKLMVSNTGDLIDDDFKQKIFERFFRIDKSRARTTGGFGLGLAITKEIVELFKGKVYLNTDPEKFINTFVIELPSNN